MLNKYKQVIENGFINRRDFIKISGILGAGLATSSIAAPLSETVKFNKNLHKISRSRPAMGTIVSITVLDPSKDHAEEALYAAFDEIERIVKILNRYDNNTPVSQLNSHGTLSGPPPELFFLINKSKYYNQISNGFFDITVKPIIDLFEKSFKIQKKFSIDNKKLAHLLRLVDSRLIELNKQSIGFKKDDVEITLDGIAKGYIVDRAMEKLMEKDITNAIINAGGDIRAIGGKESNMPWKIAIEDPLKKKNYPSVIKIKNGSIATSGNYEIFFDKERVFHHIINPKTGLSPLNNVSVSVHAPTVMEADALSTTLFVLNHIDGTKLINSLPSCESFIVTKNQRKIKSNGWHGVKI